MQKMTRVCYNCYLRLKGAISTQVVNYSSSNSKSIPTSTTKNEFLVRKIAKISKVQCRPFSLPSEDQPPAQLMNIPIYIWPNLFKSFRNAIFSKFIIKRYFDPEFDLDHFIRGSMQAAEVVSAHLSNGEWNSLNGLVTEEVISQIRINLQQYSLKQRMDLKISKEDIYIKFPYEIGIILPDHSEGETEIQNRKVEIMMVFHILKGYEDLSKSYSVPMSLLSVPDYEKKLYVLNYRFYRDFSRQGSDQWIVNGINHIKPLAHL